MPQRMLYRFTAGLLLMASSCISSVHGGEEKPVHAEDALVKFRQRLHGHVEGLRAFAHKQKASTTLGLLVDMSLPSWKKRLFAVNLQNDSILVSGLCAHGQCGDYKREEAIFSNTPGSNCTAEGHYRLGGKYSGEYGEAYRLVGLDNTNNNALKRIIVFHYYTGMSDVEDSIVCRSNGCPMVAQQVFEAAERLIDADKKPVLMWIYK